jgi:hypothetical protein
MREEVTHNMPQMRKIILTTFLQKRRFSKLSPKWNTIKLQDQMGSRLSFIRSWQVIKFDMMAMSAQLQGLLFYMRLFRNFIGRKLMFFFSK